MFGLGVNDGSEPVSYLLNRYNGHLTSVIAKHPPKKEKSVVVRPLQPWFTDEIHQARNGRKKAERLWRRTGLTVYKEIYRAETLKYSILLIASKATYFNERITECGNDSKAISKIIDDILFRHKMTKLAAYSSAPDLA